MRFLLDTNICIAVMRKHAEVVRKLSATSPSDCAISTITTYELRTGIEKSSNPSKESAKLKLLMSIVSELDFDVRSAHEAGIIRAFLESQGKMIGPYDVLLAAQARVANMTLVTANTSEFRRVPGLTVEDWTQAATP